MSWHADKAFDMEVFRTRVSASGHKIWYLVTPDHFVVNELFMV
jgi:hypothetical protein